MLPLLVGAQALVVAPPAAGQDAIRSLMTKHDPILLYVSKLLEPDVASDAGALYAWCRRLDELVDDPAVSGDPATTVARIDEWRQRLDELWEGSPRDDLDAALLVTLRRNPSLGVQPFADMLQGMRSDAVRARRVETGVQYAYQVAGTVGLMLLPLLGVSEEEDVAAARGPAIALGQAAIQLINILRDARPDAALGRIYLPRDEMAERGVDEAAVLALQCTPAYRGLVAHTLEAE
ncbi:hypothetical protein EMIHUDRAFT_68943 [Emiliania huxleyi CCMP1516]|uniref:15-cis-phytoene synthase n=2 Tax=Emiliania huxleyi TaxID=2903 RepID=A0A0D3I2V3_EMIH1|nr:hypothetical protein EMIHUDRAFT_68943 [Emiliania huxleyi CCMP1516]EOD05588.1 hypothetical protein EMIHUDRAFT_68943 [Emiliania huxleyi CCMP1516]|eukprot:XP_005758017.1 hypothetical protein EMIHUDRAFT_68943 [Emiliania huxleyi CCMP1516]